MAQRLAWLKKTWGSCQWQSPNKFFDDEFIDLSKPKWANPMILCCRGYETVKAIFSALTSPRAALDFLIKISLASFGDWISWWSKMRKLVSGLLAIILSVPRAEDLALLDTDLRKFVCIRLVCNGYEIAGGSIGIHNPEIQASICSHWHLRKLRKVWVFTGSSKFGAPPHGGIAFFGSPCHAIDRVIPSEMWSLF